MDVDVRTLKMPGASAVNYDEHISKETEPQHHREPRMPTTTPTNNNSKQTEQPKPVEPKKVKSIMDDDDIFNSVVNTPTQLPPTQPPQPVKQEESIFDMGLGGVSFQTNPPPQRAPVNNDPFNILGL